MQSQTFNPTQISLTPKAHEHVRKQLAKSEAHALVLGITETGCNGYSYELNYMTDLENLSDAKLFEFADGVKVYIASNNWQILRGTEIDYVTEGLNSTLKFNNPNADVMCGCGESFSLRGT